MKTLVIDEEKWCRGGKNGESSLLNEQGTMCCLGFLAKSCGAKDAQIKNIGMPADIREHEVAEYDYWSNLGNVVLPNELTRSVNYLDKINTRLGKSIAKINDKQSLSTKERRTKLRAKFKKLGYRLKFVNCGKVSVKEDEY